MYWTVKLTGDPNETLETEEMEQQFLIKWKGWSHINNTWESDKSLGRPGKLVLLLALDGMVSRGRSNNITYLYFILKILE